VLTIPTTFWPHLLSPGCRPIEVYEIEAFAGRAILRYSDQAVTWGGNAYTALAVQRTPIKQSMDFKVPDCTVTFSNVSNVLRAHLHPIDTLTGARMTIRLLMRDAADAVLSDSVVLFRGIIEPPAEITDTVFTLSVIGLLDGSGVLIPRRRFALNCQWAFANRGTFDGGGRCSYISNTQANGAGTDSTALTVDAASTFANGDEIQIGGTTKVAIASGGGSTSLTLAAARTWADNALVRYAECERTKAACVKRVQTHRYGGFPGIGLAARLGFRDNGRLLGSDDSGEDAPRRKPGNAELFDHLGRAGGRYARPAVAIPVLYGRRRIKGKVIELMRRKVPSDTGPFFRITFYALLEKLESIVRYFVQDQQGTDRVVGGIKEFGIYYRDGDDGVADSETEAEYSASPSTQLRSQNTDYQSLAAATYSRLGYVILRQKTDDISEADQLDADVRGSPVQAYLANGSADGSPAFSDNWIWQAVDLATEDYGLSLPIADIDLAVAKPEADYVAVLVDSTEASTTVTVAQGSASTDCFVVSTEGFIAGRRVDVNGVANTCQFVRSPTKITLGTAVTQSIGHTVIQRQSRLGSHLYLDVARQARRWFIPLLIAGRGYITYDAGKIQFRVERDTCKERLLNGDFESWASTTDANSWTENLGSGEATINRESSGVHGGTYAARIDRTGGTNFAGLTQNITGLEPGRWYRIVFWHKQSALGIGSACRLFINNTTRTLNVESDGVTWLNPAVNNPFSQQGATTWTQYEFTFKFREDFATTDTVQIGFTPYFTAGNSVWYDDASLRGPYAGDFRETTNALLMGWKDESFVWSLDRKDRETNRVAVRFTNEAADFGDDEAAADDFNHQVDHQIKTLQLEGEAIADPEQAYRVAKWKLDKLRRLGPGCAFLGSPSALALQPGDVILVSDTVPNWTREEQRVVETEIIGLGDNDELFVAVRTEDYDETIYGDVGPEPRTYLTDRPTPTLEMSVTRNAGGAIDLTLSLSDDTYAAIEYRIFMDTGSGFTPDSATMIGRSRASTFTYRARVADLDVLRYFKAVAVIDVGEIESAEVAATIFRAENVASGYSSNFQFPTTIQTADPTSYTGVYVNEAAGAATVAKVTDASDATYLKGTATGTAGTKNNDDDSIRYHSFGAGTGKTGRPYVRGAATGNPGTWGLVRYYYTLDRTAGTPTWVLWQTVTSATITDYFGPELTGVDYTKFAIRATAFMGSGGFIDRTVNDLNYRVAFDEKA
jgi:phage-related protein